MDVQDGHKFSDPSQPLIVQRWINESSNQISRKLPDYLNDLNAMHEAERTLNENERACYIQWLVKIAERDKPPFFHAVIATAPQRVEAFLKTKGLWRE